MFYNYEELQLENEIWKDAVGWEGIYQVSDFGRVRTKHRQMFYDRNLGRGVELKTVYPRIRKPKLNKHTGYLMVGLNGKGKSTNVTIHSLVAKTFIENFKSEGIGKGMCVNHKDRNKLNNNVSNLEVITIAENIRHMFATGCNSCHRLKYKGVEYISKSEFRKINKISEKRMRKMIEDKEIEIL